MYLSHIKISNFRLFEQLDLRLNKGLNVFVGENDSGKTALVDALRLALGTNSNERSFVAESDFHDDAGEFAIQLKFSDVDAHAFRFVEHLTHEEYEDEAGDQKRRSVLYVQFHAEKTGTERRGYPYIKTELRSGIEGKGLVIETEIREFLATTYLRPLRDAEAELSSGRTSRLSQILNSSKEVRIDMDVILSIVAEANDSLLKDDAALKKSAQNIQSNYLHELIFEEDKKELGAFIDIAGVKSSDLASLPENVKRRHLRAILEGLSLALTEDRRMHGLGYHNLLFMGAELLLLEQEIDKEFPLLLIEEPEAHLHPQLQMKLVQFINSKVKTDTNDEGVQCILTTHSPNISSKADPSDVILLNSGKAYPLRAGETELKPDDYKYLRKFLDATKANVFFAKAIIFVEGDAENILLPEIARLLGRPLENYGVSIVKYDNNGSWKRFARMFLRKDQDAATEAWNPTKICVLRDLDLWPDCAEDKKDGSNPYGFKTPLPGNSSYWRKNCDNEQKRRDDIAEGLDRQNISVKISNDWTFEFCLAKYGLFDECCKAIGEESIDATEDEKATYIQGQVSKTDFAYDMADILQSQLEEKVEAAVEALGADQKINKEERSAAIEQAKSEFADELKDRLPSYLVEAIEYATPNTDEDAPVNGQGADEHV